jgi:hypothetical protein
VAETFALATKGFHAHMKAKIASNDFAPAKFEDTLGQCDAAMEQKTGPLQKAYERTNKLLTSELSSVMKFLTGGITPAKVASMVRDKMEVLAHRAVATFGKLAKGGSQADLNTKLNSVTGLMFHDSLLMVRSVLAEVLAELLEEQLVKMVLTPSLAVVAPLQKAVESIPVPGLPMLIDLNAILEQLVRGVEGNAIDALVSNSVAQVKQALDAAQTEIGVSA